MPQWYRGSPVTSLSYVSADASPHLFPLSRDTICRAFCEIYRMPSGTTLLCQHIPRGQYSKIKLAEAQSDQNLSTEIITREVKRFSGHPDERLYHLGQLRAIKGDSNKVRFAALVFESTKLQNDEVLKCYLKTGLDHDM